jgi:hypothetical protein
MKRIRFIGLTLVAVFALSAVAASTAFGAESEFLTLGHASPAGIKFKGKGGKAFLESELGNKVECDKSESQGEYLGVLVAIVTLLEYSGECKLTGVFNAECPTIRIKELEVLPGTEVGSESVRLLEFLPRTGEVMTEFTCGNVKIVIKGGVFCKNLKPALGTKTEVECKEFPEKEKKLGEQEFKKGIVNGKEVEDVLTAEFTDAFTVKEKGAQNTTEEVTSEKEVEQTS